MAATSVRAAALLSPDQRCHAASDGSTRSAMHCCSRARSAWLVAGGTHSRPGLRQIKARRGWGIIAGMPSLPATVRALTFDVFGTVVDWRSSVIAEGQALGARLGLQADWAALADAWRKGYFASMARVARGELPWDTIDALHRRVLDHLLPQHGLQALDEAERAHFNQVWHRLAPWPDSVAGLQRLRQGRVVTTLSNGNLSLLVAMAKHAGLPWDAVLTAELFGRFKPDPAVYLGAARLLGLAPGQVMMVAAHPTDLAAAQRVGLLTAYIPRPAEYGPGGWMEPVGDTVFDIVASDLPDLARQLGV
jgi:2-haloacid dehalogenase